MLTRILDAIFDRKSEPKPIQKRRGSLFSTHDGDYDQSESKMPARIAAIASMQPEVMRNGSAMDDATNGQPLFKSFYNNQTSYSELTVDWFTSQSFIGHQLCGIIAQHWLVDKACSMPAQDAVRKGWAVVKDDGEELSPELAKIIKSAEKRHQMKAQMREFVRKGRVFGIRICMFKVESTEPDYYEKPFNIDGVKKNAFKGVVQLDPYWCAPMLDQDSASRPESLHFYEPTWWMVAGKKIHRSHLLIFRHNPPIDILKPVYLYGGVPLAQMLYERVFAAERTANEAPQLVQTKRTNVWLTDMEAAMTDESKTIQLLNMWTQYRDNYGVKLGDKDSDEFQQFDTTLTDLDAVIMTQYQLVAATANVPATKLLGTQPKGFNSSGDYEEAVYHELLESIQENDLTPFAERFYQMVIKSETGKNIDVSISWNPLDTPTAKELAETNLIKSQTGQQLVMSGALSSEEERQRIATDKSSGYNELGLSDALPVTDNPEDEEIDVNDD